MVTTKELKELFRKHNFHPRKRLGQNFLIDENIARKIIEASNITQEDVVLEVGAGLGQLTEYIARKAGFVYAVELDRLLCDILKARLGAADNLAIFCKDILELDIKAALGGKKATVIGNLPYYITSPIVIKLLQERGSIEEIFVMVQKEFAQRLLSTPGGRDYGSITCYVTYFARPAALFDISKHSFYPRPEVDSEFLSLKILPEPPVLTKDEDLFFKIIRASFGQRRKTILNAIACGPQLKADKGEVLEILEGAGIDPSRRGETLSLEEFAAVADAWYNYNRYGRAR